MNVWVDESAEDLRPLDPVKVGVTGDHAEAWEGRLLIQRSVGPVGVVGILMLLRELNIRIITKDGGDPIRELVLDPTRDCQPQAR